MTTLITAARSRRGRWTGGALGAFGLTVVTVALTPSRSLTNAALLYLVPVVVVAAIGGVWLGLAAAIASTALLNWFFTAPLHTLSVTSQDNLVALVVYVLVAMAVSLAVDLAARQRAAAEAARLRATQRVAEAQRLTEIDKVRTAILAAVGHDLRTPLAGIKAAASSLRAPDVAFSDADRDELLETVEESADRLNDLVENLLAMSRLQAGVLSVELRPVALDEVVARALLHNAAGGPVRVEVGDDLPLVLADAGLLELVVVNLVSNAQRAGGISGVTISGSVADGRVALAVLDHGPGVDPADRSRMFDPFQRLGDHGGLGDHGVSGMGLGLAIVRGFTEAMAATVTPTETPGGGLTMTVSLPVAT